MNFLFIQKVRGACLPSLYCSGCSKETKVICEIFEVRVFVDFSWLLGHVISREGVIVDTQNIEAVMSWFRLDL